jgi:hypothetical protein
MARTSTADKKPASAKANADKATPCKHLRLLPTDIDEWTCQECGDKIVMKDGKAVDSKGRKLSADTAQTLLDGKTGGVKEPEAKTPANGAQRQPEQIELVKLSNDDIIHSVTLKQAEINVAKSEAGRARKRVKDLLDQREQMINELIGRDALKYNLQLDLGDGDDEDDDD